MRKRSNRRSRVPPLDERHYRAIEMLAGSHDNHEDIARALGVSRMTLYRWRRRPDFARELRKAIDRRSEQLRRELSRKFPITTARDIEWYFGHLVDVL